MNNTSEFNLKDYQKNLFKGGKSIGTIIFEIVLIIMLIYSLMFIIGGISCMDSDISIKVSAYILLLFCITYLIVCCVIIKNCSSIRELINAANNKLAKAADIHAVILIVINVLFYLYFFISLFSARYTKNDSIDGLILFSTLMVPYVDAFQFPIMYCFRFRKLARNYLMLKITVFILIFIALFHYMP